MKRAHRVPLLSLILVLSTVGGSTARDSVRLRTDAEPISTDMVEGGMSIFELLESLGRSFDIDVVFDPKMRDGQVELRLRDVGPEEAFDRVAAAAGLMWVALDERSVLFAEDNPQMRRRYEAQVVQTFYLEHARLRDMMTLLRSTLGARSVTAVEQLHALTLRDTAGRVALARELIARHDRAPAILEVEVRLLRLGAGALAQVADGGDLPARPDAKTARTLAAAARTIARPTLVLADGAEARLELGSRGGEDAGAAFDLTLSGRLATSDGTVTLKARIEGDSAGAPGEPAERRRLTATLRLAPGETWAVSGLLWAAGEGAGEPDQVVVLLTPRVATPSTVRAADREPLAAGTEERLGLESDG